MFEETKLYCHRRIEKVVFDWFVKGVIMATRYAEKYRRRTLYDCELDPILFEFKFEFNLF